MDVAMDTSDEVFDANEEQTWEKIEAMSPAVAAELMSKDGVDYQRSGSNSGKFTLRSSRVADPLHFIHRLYQQSDIDPELEELITVLRTTDTGQIGEEERTALQSLITSELVKQFDRHTSEEQVGLSEGLEETVVRNKSTSGEANEINADQIQLEADILEKKGDLYLEGDQFEVIPEINDLQERDGDCGVQGQIPAPETSLTSKDVDDHPLDPETCLNSEDIEGHTQGHLADLETCWTSDHVDDAVDEGQNQGHLSDEETICASGHEPEHQFEQVTESGELPSPTQTLTDAEHEPMSLKEELADQEEEKTKDQDNAGSSFLDLDLPLGENQIPLNLEANKQRAQLRQKGSLAKRRKPTRASVRAISTDDSSALDNKDASEPIFNGHDKDNQVSSSPEEPSTPEKPPTEAETNIDMSTATQGSMLGTGKTIHGIKTAIVKPEVVESGRQRLRSVPPSSSQPPVPHPSVSEAQATTPPWLLETRLKKSSRPPKGETEKLKQETQPETPTWMKDALAKKRRAAEKTQEAVNSAPVEASSSVGESEITNLTPWMKEMVQRKSNRPSVTEVTPKDVRNNVNSRIADSSKMESESSKSHEAKSKEATNQVKGQDAKSKVTANQVKPKEITNQVKGQEDKHMEITSQVSVQEDKVKKVSSQVSVQEAKVKKVSSQVPAHVSHDDDIPASSTAVAGTAETTSKKSIPPVRQTVLPSTSADKESPAWKAEVALRRKNKAYIVPQKPEQPLKLGEIPQWKKDLLEKNKQRRVSDSTDLLESSRSDSTGDNALPPWKQEVDQRRKRQSAIPRVSYDEPERDKEEKKAPEEEPEWAQLVAMRRQKLAISGLLPNERSGQIE